MAAAAAAAVTTMTARRIIVHVDDNAKWPPPPPPRHERVKFKPSISLCNTYTALVFIVVVVHSIVVSLMLIECLVSLMLIECRYNATPRMSNLTSSDLTILPFYVKQCSDDHRRTHKSAPLDCDGRLETERARGR
jgi:hypothetical protein